MAIQKPTFSNVSTAQIKARLDKLADLTKAAKDSNGKLSLEKLANAVKQQNDPALESTFEFVRGYHPFQKTETVQEPARTGSCGAPATGGCGSQTVSRSRMVQPTTLEAAQVRELLDGIGRAKAQVDQYDAVEKKDGALSRKEIHDVVVGAYTLENGLIQASVREAADQNEASFKKWNDAVNAAVDSLDARKSLDAEIRKAASFHAETPEGIEALTWKYRGALVRSVFNPLQMEKGLQNAESSWLSKVPLFGGHEKTKAHHLNDAEVSKLVGDSDLKSFSEKARLDVKAYVGGEYDAHFLAGKDLPEAAQAKDPDFIRVPSYGGPSRGSC